MKHLVILGSALTLGACVTINIYFPAAAAEKAADKLIDEIWQVQKQGKPAPGAPAAPTAPVNPPANKE